MKTKLPKEIKNVEEAKVFLTELLDNRESFHPEDNAHDIDWTTCNPSYRARVRLNKLMDDIYSLHGNESHKNMIFDPCGFILDLNIKNQTL